MTRKHLLKDLTFVEFRERMTEDPVVLLPFGSQEEQGPACPMGDWMLTEALAAQVAERAGALAAPTVPFGYADYFRPIPGGVQLRADTFVRLFRDVCDNFLDHGLTRLVVFNGHTGNHPLIDRATRELRRDRGVVIPCLNIWRLIPQVLWDSLHPQVGLA
ncbi:MAG: creatininase family protein, partial [bacterium]|nr:creatininase family protein [bacterium]